MPLSSRAECQTFASTLRQISEVKQLFYQCQPANENAACSLRHDLIVPVIGCLEHVGKTAGTARDGDFSNLWLKEISQY